MDIVHPTFGPDKVVTNGRFIGDAREGVAVEAVPAGAVIALEIINPVTIEVSGEEPAFSRHPAVAAAAAQRQTQATDRAAPV